MNLAAFSLRRFPPALAGGGRKGDLRRSLTLCAAEGFVAMPIVTMALPVNVFLTALVTQAFPLTNAAIGVFSAAPFLANFLAIFALPALSRWRPAKTLTVATAVLHWASWLALAFYLPHLPHADPARAGRWLIAWFFVSSGFLAVASVTWNSWIQEWVPARLRGTYFGRRNRLTQFSTTAFLLAAGWAVGRWHYAIPAFQAIVCGAALLRVISLRWQWISPTHSVRAIAAETLPLAAQLDVLRRSPSLLAFIVFGSVWSFGTYCFGPFYQVFMFDQAHLTAFQVGLTATLSQLGGALSLPAWGALIDRFGNKPVMIVSLLLWQIPNFLWCVIVPDHPFALDALWLWAGATSAGFVLGQFTLLLRLIPLEAKNLAIGLNLGVTSLFAAAAPVLGGYFLQWALRRGADPLAVYHGCFAVQPILTLAGAWVLLRVREPAAQPLAVVVGAMRNVRTLSGVLGLSFLTNYLFFIRPKSKQS